MLLNIIIKLFYEVLYKIHYILKTITQEINKVVKNFNKK